MSEIEKFIEAFKDCSSLCNAEYCGGWCDGCPNDDKVVDLKKLIEELKSIERKKSYEQID
jgi:hypothetical protein